MKTRSVWILSFIILIFASTTALAQFSAGEKRELDDYKQLTPQRRQELSKKLRRVLSKTAQDDPRHEVLKETIITGNQIRVLVTNQGSISTPDADNANADLVWPAGPSGLGYAFEFGPLVGAEVVDANGDTVHIVSDGFFASGSGGEINPETFEKWGWEPRVGFSDPRSNEVAHFSDLDRNLDGKPDSWPEGWFNETLGRYVWPAFLGDDATTPDEEVFYVMDDFDNAEFQYFPTPSDSTIRGLGLELQVRIFQFNNPLAEDLIFLVYTVTNVSSKRLDKVFLGMFGDPHVGGPNDFADDNAGFISAFDEEFPFNTRNMLFAFDADGRGDQNKVPGYFGYRFLESPGIDNDGQDNDNDDLVDESAFNDAGVFTFGPVGIYGEPREHWSGDEDGDWNPDFDDVGVDGIAGTGDFGENDGKPNQLFFLDINNNSMLDPGEPFSERREPGMRFLGGEPNFGFLDIAESDQLGLTSFNAILFGGNNRPRNDQLMWDLMSTPNQRPGDPPPEIEQEADNVFIYGSGPFSLAPGESQRFSIALLLGVNFQDLLTNAEISQQVFESDYRFAQAPRKPRLVAVPGDRKVTLYWDTGAEESFDPFVARANEDDPDKGFDFEGYRIYRSRDFSFNDTQTITDSRGVPFLSVPLQQPNGLPAQFDLINQYQGLSTLEYEGRGVRYDLGRNTGLVHSYVDSNNVQNGITYFYAVTSYDHGDENAGVAPTESQRVIQRDAIDRTFSFDVNTAMVIPGPPAAGYNGPGLKDAEGNLATLVTGNATGTVSVAFLNPLKVQEGKTYDVIFEKVPLASGDTTVGYSVVDQRELSTTFTSRDTILVDLRIGFPILEESVTLTNAAGGVVDPSRYILLAESGRIRGAAAGDLPLGETFTLTFKVTPVANSTAVNNEDSNPVFDGIRVFVRNEETALDPLSTQGGRSGFKSLVTNTNFSDKFTTIGLADVGNPQPFPADFEIHFTNYDTTADGKLISPADTSILTHVVAPFRIVNVETGERVRFFISEPPPTRNGRWDWQETIRLIRPDFTAPTQTTYRVKFSPPVDTLMAADSTDSLVTRPPVYPGEGDVFLLFSRKPFAPGHQYTFTTRAANFDDRSSARAALDNVFVVPNPYIAFSASEIAGVSSGVRDDRRIEFRNLPPKCTIRIYTITGEFVDKIEKDDARDFATWDLLTFEAQEIAYGVYIYHVEAPGIGTKIGRLAIIK